MPRKVRKIAIMGYRSVGKSSLTIQFVDNHFVDAYEPTIENTFTKNFVCDGEEYSLKLVDTAGQDEYSIISQSYAMDIHGYVLVYSINSLKSFDVIKKLYDKLLDMVGKIDFPILLVGNKVDLNHERVVRKEEGQMLAQTMKAAFLEATATQYTSVEDVFKTILHEIDKANGKNAPTEKGGNCALS